MVNISKKTKIAIVILNYNGKHFLEKFLKDVIQLSPEARVIVADNASTDNSLEWLQRQRLDTEIIRIKKNLGYAGGYNEALRQVKATYYILLNSDVEVTKNWIEPIIGVLETNPQIVACQPKIKDFNNRTHFEYAGAGGGFIDYLGYPFCRGRIFDTLEEDKGQYNDTTEVFWATGACLFVKAKVFHDLGGFDADFFAHMEEIDFCWRAKNVGYRIYYCGKSEVYHVGGGTLPKSNPRKTFLNFRNNLALLYKNLPPNKLYQTLFVRLVLDKIAIIQFLVRGSFGESKAILKAYFTFYSKVKTWQKKRPKNLSKDLAKQIYRRSIVWEYFVKKKKRYRNL